MSRFRLDDRWLKRIIPNKARTSRPRVGHQMSRFRIDVRWLKKNKLFLKVCTTLFLALMASRLSVIVIDRTTYYIHARLPLWQHNLLLGHHVYFNQLLHVMCLS